MIRILILFTFILVALIFLSMALLIIIGSLSFVLRALEQFLNLIIEFIISRKKQIIKNTVYDKTFHSDQWKSLLNTNTLPMYTLANMVERTRDTTFIATNSRELILYWNPIDEKLLGYKTKINQRWVSVVDPYVSEEIEALGNLLKLLTGECSDNFECIGADCLNGVVEKCNWRWLKSDIMSIPVSFIIKAIDNRRGVAEGFLIVAHDCKNNKKRLLHNIENGTVGKAEILTENERQEKRSYHHTLEAATCSIDDIAVR